MPVRVLHVDDDPDFAEMVAEFVGRANDRLEIVTETSAASGLDRLADGSIDCVVSDYQMPGMDGLEFLTAVREDYPDLPFVLFTGRGSEEVASEAISHGATDYLQKRTGTEQYELLANRVDNAVDQYRSTHRAANLERIRTLAADVNQALIRASSLAEIETDVCQIFSEAEPYRFAWIGSVDHETGRVEPRTSAGEGEDYLEGMTITLDESDTGSGPGGRAIREGRVVVTHDVRRDPAFEPWRDAAIEYEFRSVAAVPLTVEETNYGLLVVYANRTDAFDETEVELLTDLGNDVSRAIYAIETGERLREEHGRRSALFENNPDPVVDFTFRDETPIITSVNPAFETVFGFSPDAIVGEPIGDVLVPEADVDEHDDIRRRVYRGEPVEAEVRRRTASGDRDFLLRVFPYDVDDHSNGGYAWYVDVSDRTAREDRLAHQQSLLRAVMETSIDGILVIDEDRAAVTWNQRFLDLWDVPEDVIRDEPETTSLAFAIDQVEEPDEFVETIEYLYEHRHEESRDQIRLVDGRVFDRYSAPVESPDGIYFGRVWFFRDVTDRVDAFRALEAKNTQLEEFASIVSHDLRNPLNVAEGRLQLVRSEYDDDDLDAIGRALDRMGILVDDLLTLAREGSELEATEAVDLPTLVESCWGTVETVEAELRLETTSVVLADESRLQQLVENLIRNAIEHGGRDVTVTVGDLDDGEGFYVEDTGPGVPPADRERVFESGVSTFETGTGFGLAIVDRIANAHGWTITLTEGHAGGARIEISGVETVE